jgi:hypothetical protein
MLQREQQEYDDDDDDHDLTARPIMVIMSA